MIWVPKAKEEGRMIKDLMTEEAAESKYERDSHCYQLWRQERSLVEEYSQTLEAGNRSQLTASKLMETSVIKPKELNSSNN